MRIVSAFAVQCAGDRVAYSVPGEGSARSRGSMMSGISARGAIRRRRLQRSPHAGRCLEPRAFRERAAEKLLYAASEGWSQLSRRPIRSNYSYCTLKYARLPSLLQTQQPGFQEPDVLKRNRDYRRRINFLVIMPSWVRSLRKVYSARDWCAAILHAAPCQAVPSIGLIVSQ